MPRKSTIITWGDIFDSLTTIRRKRAVNAVYGGVISTLFLMPIGNPIICFFNPIILIQTTCFISILTFIDGGFYELL